MPPLAQQPKPRLASDGNVPAQGVSRREQLSEWDGATASERRDRGIETADAERRERGDPTARRDGLVHPLRDGAQPSGPGKADQRDER